MKLPLINSADELQQLVEEIGFLPFFRTHISGYSLEECTPPGRWFEKGVEGPWEWREELALRGSAAYGKLFMRKAGFVSPAWYPVLANYRRDGYDFDARFEDGLAPHNQKAVMDLVLARGPMLSVELKEQSGIAKGFDTVMQKLQMQTYLTVREFRYKRDRFGFPQGWGVGRYCMPEDIWGADTLAAGYAEEPADSFGRIVEHIAALWPGVDRADIVKLIK